MATKVKVGIAAAVVVIGIAISLLVFLTGQEQETIEKLDNSVTSTHSEQNRSEYIGGKLSTKGDGEDREDVKSRISFVDLTGHLLSKSDGSDIANAKVVVSKLPYTPEAGSAQEVTDSTGKFIVKVPLPDSDETSGFHLCFSAKGFSDLKTWVPFNPSREHMELGSYYLEENEEFTLRIIDSEGNPRPNAQVQYFGIEDPKPVWKKKTDTEGYIYFSEQELMSWGQNPLLNYIVLHVSADGFADCFFNKMIRNNESPPKELAIEKSAIWNGIVSVKDTNTPIPNATIRVHPFFDVGEQFVEVMKTTTDESGRFELPLFTFYENPRLYVCVSAAGYCGSMSTPKNSIPTKIELIRATKHITCLVIDEEKQTPLVQLPLIVNDKDTAVTDDSGQFLLTNYGGKRMNLRVTSVDGEMYYRGGYRPDDYSDKKLIIPLKRQIQNKLRMKVEDELGMPIVGAWGRLYLSSDDRSPESDFHTDENGIGIFEFQISNPFDAIVIVDKKGYYTEKPVNVRLGRKQNEDRTEKDIVINIVMKKGTLFQKIRVVNENKNSKKKFQKVVAEIVLEDGTTATINERTDEKGLCEMTFPPFREGILFIHDRPDTIVPIDYGRILENDWIDIYVYDQLDTNNSVSGLVRDEDGTPLEDISFFPVVSDGSDRKISAIRTDSVGKFCLPAFRNEVFKLTIRPLFKNGKFYFASEESGLTAGTSIEVTMKSVPGVKIDLYGLFKNRDYRLHDYDCWLERPDGNRLQVTEYHKFFLSVVFLNVPDGAAKAIVISHSGRQYETEYFDVKAGKTSEEVQLVEN